MQFRADIFNIFNHPNFENPSGGICNAVLSATPTTPASCTTANSNFRCHWPNHRRLRMERKLEAAPRGKPNSHSGSLSDHSAPAYHGSDNRPSLPYLQDQPASEDKCRSHTSRTTISIPSVRVSDSRDGCEMGWDAIGRRLKASVQPGRFVICVECYPGCFEKEIEKQLVSALKPQIVLRAEECYLPESAIQSLCARDLGDDPVFAFMGKYELSEFLDERELAKQRDPLAAGIRHCACHWHGRNPACRAVGPARLLRHGEVGDPAVASAPVK